MNNPEQQTNGGTEREISSEELAIRAQHKREIAKIEAETATEMARLDAERTRQMPIALRVFFDDRLYERATAIAERMASAEGFTPQHLIGKPGACFAVVSKALAWNLDPFSVAQSTYHVGGRVAYEGRLVQAIMEASGRLKGGIHARYIGDWSKVEGKFRLEGNKPVRTWTDADETGLGIVLRTHLHGEDEPREFEFFLRQCHPRNASTWPIRPKQHMHYNAIRAFASVAAPSLLLGVPFQDDMQAEPPMRDITPESEQHLREPINAITYVEIYGTDGAAYRLQPGEVEAWLREQVRGAMADELDGLIENNPDEPAVRQAVENEMARRTGGEGPQEPVQASQSAAAAAGQNDTGEPATTAQEAEDPPQLGKRRRRSYQEIVSDVITMLADVQNVAEIDEILEDEVTSGVRANAALMAEIEKAAAGARVRLSSPPQESQEQDPPEFIRDVEENIADEEAEAEQTDWPHYEVRGPDGRVEESLPLPEFLKRIEELALKAGTFELQQLDAYHRKTINSIAMQYTYTSNPAIALRAGDALKALTGE